jgi:hypothetical protein
MIDSNRLAPSILLFLGGLVAAGAPLASPQGRHYPMGLLPDRPGWCTERERLTLPKGLARLDLPRRVDVRSVMPPIADQAPQGSCAAFATAYALSSSYHHQARAWPLTDARGAADPGHVMSPAYVYNSLNGGEDRGLMFEPLIDFIQTKGNVPEREMPYNPRDFLTRPPPRLYAIGPELRVPRVMILYDPASGQTDLDALKLALTQKRPVVVGMRLNRAFQQLGAGVWSDRNGLGVIEGKHALHAMCLVGYDDAKGTRGAFLLQNSWGTDWGDRGYGWADYGVFAESCFAAFTFEEVLAPRPQPNPQPQPDPQPQPQPNPQPNPFQIFPAADPAKVMANFRQLNPGDDWKRVIEVLGAPDVEPRFDVRGDPVAFSSFGLFAWPFRGTNGRILNVTFQQGRVSKVAFKRAE